MPTSSASRSTAEQDADRLEGDDHGRHPGAPARPVTERRQSGRATSDELRWRRRCPGMEAHRPVDIAYADEAMTFREFVALYGGASTHAVAGTLRPVRRPPWPTATGPGPCEMHPVTDELLRTRGIRHHRAVRPRRYQRVPLDAGSLVVVARGRWHRHVDAANLVELYHTHPVRASAARTHPQQSENDVRYSRPTASSIAGCPPRRLIARYLRSTCGMVDLRPQHHVR